MRLEAKWNELWFENEYVTTEMNEIGQEVKRIVRTLQLEDQVRQRLDANHLENHLFAS
jgi:hypothetical protein